MNRKLRSSSVLILLLMLLAAAGADTYQKIGAGIVGGDGALSCWLVDSDVVGRGVAIKISGVGKAGEANVLLTRTQIKDLKALCRKAFAYREPLKEGQIEILGTFVVYDTRLEVVVLRSHGTVARCLVAHEKDKEQTFFMEESQEGALNRLLDDAAAALK